MKLKVSCDLDGVIFNFEDYYSQIFGRPKYDSDINKNIQGCLRKDKDFWLKQPLIRKLNFTPNCYCTARVINKKWIKEQLIINDLPKAPIYQVFGYGLSKAPQVRRSSSDVHVDDSIKVFIDLNLKGIPCLLVNTTSNQDWGPIGRIFSLDKEEIEDSYFLFKDTLFNYFKDLVDEYKQTK